MAGRKKRRFDIEKRMYTNNYHSLVEPRLEEVTMLRLDGYSLNQIARYLGVNESSFHMWCRKYQPLQDALMDGTAQIENQLEQAMIKSAKGYYYTEERTIEILDAEGNVISTRKEKHKKWMKENTLLLTNLAKFMNKDKWDNEDKEKDIKIELDEGLDQFAK